MFVPRLIPALMSLSVMAACSNGDANHLGNPLTWPFGAVSAGIDNATYGAKRRQVERFVNANHPALIGEITRGGGPLLDQAMNLAAIPGQTRPGLRTLLQSDIEIYRNDPEALIVALMVHGN